MTILKPVFLDYDYDIFLNADYSVHQGSCIKHQIHELTDIHDKYEGFPDSYNFHNTKIHQLWWTEDQIDFKEIGKQLGMEVVTVSSIKQPAGNVIPLHRDTFYQVSKKYPDRKEIKVRSNIYLEDWKVGHIIQYLDGDTYKTDTYWKKGQGWQWDETPLHIGANIGFQPKYTLQVSGFVI